MPGLWNTATAVKIKVGEVSHSFHISRLFYSLLFLSPRKSPSQHSKKRSATVCENISIKYSCGNYYFLYQKLSDLRHRGLQCGCKHKLIFKAFLFLIQQQVYFFGSEGNTSEWFSFSDEPMDQFSTFRICFFLALRQ